MQQILNETLTTRGIIALFISNMKGNVVASAGKFGQILTRPIAREALELFRKEKKLKRSTHWIQIYYKQMVVLINVQADFFVTVLCQPENDPALIRLTIEVAISNIRKNKKMLRQVIDS